MPVFDLCQFLTLLARFGPRTKLVTRKSVGGPPTGSLFHKIRPLRTTGVAFQYISADGGETLPLDEFRGPDTDRSRPAREARPGPEGDDSARRRRGETGPGPTRRDVCYTSSPDARIEPPVGTRDRTRKRGGRPPFGFRGGRRRMNEDSIPGEFPSRRPFSLRPSTSSKLTPPRRAMNPERITRTGTWNGGPMKNERMKTKTKKHGNRAHPPPP